MTPEQRAIIAAAEKDGVSPIEKDARLIVHGMVNATRDQMRKYQVGYDKMGEAQQDAVIADLTAAYDELAITIARALASAGSPAVVMTCKKLEVSNGTFTGIVKSDQPFYNDLISKVQDKGEVVVALYERQYRDGMETIKGDKDQRALPLDDEPAKPTKGKRASAETGSATSASALAKKATELPPKLLEYARAFIDNQQVVTVSGVQNHLKIGAVKAGAVLEQMEVEGRVKFVGDSKSGEYQKVHTSKTSATKRTIKHKDGELITTDDGSDPFEGLDDPEDWSEVLESPKSEDGVLSFDGDDDQTEEPGDAQPVAQILTDEIFGKVKAEVLKTKRVSSGALSIKFCLDDEIVEQAIQRLEMEGVISEENEAGVRTVNEAE